MNFLKGKTLREKEEEIKRRSSTDEQCHKAYNNVKMYYKINFDMNKSCHFGVFEAIYEIGIKMPLWKLAIYCKVSRTSLFDYRNDIIRCFENCLRNNNYVDEEDKSVDDSKR